MTNASRRSLPVLATAAMAFLPSTVVASEKRVIESVKPLGFTTTAWVLGLLSTLLAVASMAFVVFFRSNKIVTVGQPFFLCLICLGSLLLSISIYFDAGSIEEIEGISWSVLDKLCITQLWCLYCGMLTIHLALVCKLWRAEKVCKFRKGKTILVRHVLWPLVGVILVELVLLIVATAVCPPSWQELELEFFGSLAAEDVQDFIPRCFASPVPAMEALRGISHALILVSQIVVVWMAYQTRKIPEEIVDTKRVYYLMVCQLILYVPYVLIEYGLLPTGGLYHYFTLVFPFLFSVTAVGFTIFPKVYYVQYFRRHGELPERARESYLIGTNHVHVTRSSVVTGSHHPPHHRLSASTGKRHSAATTASTKSSKSGAKPNANESPGKSSRKPSAASHRSTVEKESHCTATETASQSNHSDSHPNDDGSENCEENGL